MTVLFESIAGRRPRAHRPRLAARPPPTSRPTRTTGSCASLFDPLRRVTANRPDGLEVSPLVDGPTRLRADRRRRSRCGCSPPASTTRRRSTSAAATGRPPRSARTPPCRWWAGWACWATWSPPPSPRDRPCPAPTCAIVAAADTPDAVLDRAHRTRRRAAGVAGGPARRPRPRRRRRPGPRLRADGRRLRAGRPAGPGRRGGPAPCAATATTSPRCACSASGSASPAGPGAPSWLSLAVLVVLAVAVGGWAAVELLLGGLPLLTPPPAAQPLDTGSAAAGPRAARGAGRAGRARGRRPRPRRTGRDDAPRPAA